MILSEFYKNDFSRFVAVGFFHVDGVTITVQRGRFFFARQNQNPKSVNGEITLQKREKSHYFSSAGYKADTRLTFCF